MVITGSDIEGIDNLKIYLISYFQMKDLGSFSYFLGIEVGKSNNGYFVSQVKYASEIIQRAGISDTNIVDTPLEVNMRHSPTYGTLSNPTFYRKLVGSLNYLTITRHDISHAVRSLQFSSKYDLTLKAYSDSDWAGDVTNRQSITGYFVFLGDSLISWRSKKQTIVSRSSAEAEYRVLAHTTSEIIWLLWLLSDMGIHLHNHTPMFCDNKASIQITDNDVFHERT
ncbi:uncharacterized protein LOC113329636 [Papaver somniferum]|uniref:uncharacterized protein LOC113329636 n=1 Tax=Papaver somniferum TaxID=3469 RepID=UPI000E70257D|nr:uncharacterized protein LOC113329636 [Papaver somniferum]